MSDVFSKRSEMRWIMGKSAADVCLLYFPRDYFRKNKAKRRLRKLQIIISEESVDGRGFSLLPSMLMLDNPNYNIIDSSNSYSAFNEIPRKYLTLLRLIGQGAFGEVYQGVLCGSPYETNLSVAVKTLPALCTEQTEIDFILEAVIISRFDHPNIVNIIGVCFEKRPRFIVLELLEGGDVQSFLRGSRPNDNELCKLSVLDLLSLTIDIANGCHHLEEKHFIHRDIAARNCLLSTKDSGRVAKIADFGLARDVYRSDYYKKSGKTMLPVKWMPPEAFLDGMFTSKTDVWSYGILLWEIFALGHVPYPGCSNDEVMQYVMNGGRLNPPASCPPAVFDIMVSCWSGIAEDRPSFNLILTSLEKFVQDDVDSCQLQIPFYFQPITRTNKISLPSNNYLPSCQMSINEQCEYLEPLISNLCPVIQYIDSGHPATEVLNSSEDDSVIGDSDIDVKICSLSTDKQDNNQILDPSILNMDNMNSNTASSIRNKECLSSADVIIHMRANSEY